MMTKLKSTHLGRAVFLLAQVNDKQDYNKLFVALEELGRSFDVWRLFNRRLVLLARIVPSRKMFRVPSLIANTTSSRSINTQLKWLSILSTSVPWLRSANSMNLHCSLSGMRWPRLNVSRPLFLTPWWSTSATSEDKPKITTRLSRYSIRLFNCSRRPETKVWLTNTDVSLHRGEPLGVPSYVR